MLTPARQKIKNKIPLRAEKIILVARANSESFDAMLGFPPTTRGARSPGVVPDDNGTIRGDFLKNFLEPPGADAHNPGLAPPPARSRFHKHAFLPVDSRIRRHPSTRTESRRRGTPGSARSRRSMPRAARLDRIGRASEALALPVATFTSSPTRPSTIASVAAAPRRAVETPPSPHPSPPALAVRPGRDACRATPPFEHGIAGKPPPAAPGIAGNSESESRHGPGRTARTARPPCSPRASPPPHQIGIAGKAEPRTADRTCTPAGCTPRRCTGRRRHPCAPARVRVRTHPGTRVSPDQLWRACVRVACSGSRDSHGFGLLNRAASWSRRARMLASLPAWMRRSVLSIAARIRGSRSNL